MAPNHAMHPSESPWGRFELQYSVLLIGMAAFALFSGNIKIDIQITNNSRDVTTNIHLELMNHEEYQKYIVSDFQHIQSSRPGGPEGGLPRLIKGQGDRALLLQDGFNIAKGVENFIAGDFNGDQVRATQGPATKGDVETLNQHR
ncbi:hypothetical protein F4680DRAFT_449143 [Xylaria scruposa]|nr:hypothetical protein F4680DRAFT_449143 [Xylaria scruposa]